MIVETLARPRTSPALVILLVMALVATGVGWLATSNALSARDRDLRAAIGRLDGFEQRLNALQTQIEDLGKQIESIEGRANPDLVRVAEEIQQSVYVVQTRSFLGSSFVLRSGSRQSLLVTNYHVVQQDWEAGIDTVQIVKEGRSLVGTILEVNEAKDLALIRVGFTLPALEFTREKPKVGDPVLVVGSPFGLEGTVATGIVSAFRDGFIQFDAPVSPGDSGGPLVDGEGRVIGVTALKVVAAGAEGLGFAIPIAVVCRTVLEC